MSHEGPWTGRLIRIDLEPTPVEVERELCGRGAAVPPRQSEAPVVIESEGRRVEPVANGVCVGGVCPLSAVAVLFTAPLFRSACVSV